MAVASKSASASGAIELSDAALDLIGSVLGAAHAWVEAEDMSKPSKRAIHLALSNALMTNNRLCSYAIDYGRLSPLYSVRGYSLPALAVELNPLHSSGGRGTIRQCLNRVLRSARTTTRRSIWNVDTGTTEKVTLDLPRRAPSVDVRCSPAADAVLEAAIDLLVFDPPYYDYIHTMSVPRCSELGTIHTY